MVRRAGQLNRSASLARGIRGEAGMIDYERGL